MDPTTRANRIAWEKASQKYGHEDFLAQAAAGSSLFDIERHLLRDVLGRRPEVVHRQSGHGLEDVALVQAGARSVVGVDYSVEAARRRADRLGVTAAAWDGRLPNSFSLLVRRPAG